MTRDELAAYKRALETQRDHLNKLIEMVDGQLDAMRSEQHERWWDHSGEVYRPDKPIVLPPSRRDQVLREVNLAAPRPDRNGD